MRTKKESHQNPQKKTTKSVLVVDDVLSIVELLKDILLIDGHEVDTAMSGKEALQKILVNMEKYDVIITDIKMPDMGGEELYKRVLSMNTSLAKKIVFTTGDVFSYKTQCFLEKTENKYLMKPFKIEEIRDLCK
ncbi:MAG: response regulator [Thermodesulfobacteriota bacterium]|nr:response regulator [Thermodesulfobacteriota bacterium]